MGVFTNYLERLGSNFLVAAMVPSMALVVACILVFDPILNVASAFQDPKGTPQLVSFGLIVFIITVIVGFTLTALNTFILKMFEGYVVIPPIRFIYNKTKRIHVARARSLAAKRDRIRSWIERYEDNDHIIEHDLDIEKLHDQYYKVASDYDLAYPDDIADILPTRFGNTLKAAENYPGKRYGFDGVQLWPRLIQVIPEEYKASIDSVRNELSFLVNVSILSAFFSFLCILAIFISMGSVAEAGSDPAVFIHFIDDAVRYLAAAAGGMILFAFFYNASIFSVSSFGLVVRSTFDLFRLDLLRQLGMKRPLDSIEEFEKWEKLNELIVLGSHSLTFTKLDYRSEE